MRSESISIGGCHLQVAEQGSGSPLLLVHGFPLDHSMWSGQLEGLSNAVRVIAPDLRGFGRSGGEGEPVVRMEQFADDLARLLDGLKIQQRVVFCGLSMGGYIGFQFWARHRERLSGLILCDTRSAADTPEGVRGRLRTAEQVLAEGTRGLAEEMLGKLFAPTTVAQQPELLEATRNVMQQASPSAVAAALRGMAERPDFTPLLSQIDVPTFVICGESDAISPPTEMQAMARGIPTAEYLEIAGAGHLAPLERPQAVNEAISGWISDL
jgi:pimeloyl-ACP methyl ester carboxylesterase